MSDLLIKDTTGQAFNPKVQKLRQMQSLSLEEKIVASKHRIKEWYEHFEGNVYVSFSGGQTQPSCSTWQDRCIRTFKERS